MQHFGIALEKASNNNHIPFRYCAAISLLPEPSPVREWVFDPTSPRREASLFNLAGAFGFRPFLLSAARWNRFVIGFFP
jgi:hypothetical protein